MLSYARAQTSWTCWEAHAADKHEPPENYKTYTNACLIRLGTPGSRRTLGIRMVPRQCANYVAGLCPRATARRLKGGKMPSDSSGPTVDMVKAAEH